MSSDLFLNTILSKLIEQEKLLADFYFEANLVADKYSEMWNDLYFEEKKHAEVLENIKEKYKDEVNFIRSDLVNFTVIKHSIEYIQSKMQILKGLEVKTIEVLELALELEKNTTEALIFESIDSKDKDIADSIKWLNSESSKHIEMLENAIKEHNKKSSGVFSKLRYLMK